MYRSIDLFAGIGGIRKGFDNAFGKDIETVFVSEWDEYAQKTYKLNYHDDFDIAGDITKIDEKDIPEFDICLAGFPCQAFSLAGKRMGFDDDYKGMCRGTLFQDVVRICEYRQPKVIFCENVKGLTIIELTLEVEDKVIDFIENNALKQPDRIDYINYLIGFFIFNASKIDDKVKARLINWYNTVDFTNKSNTNRRDMYTDLIKMNNF